MKHTECTILISICLETSSILDEKIQKIFFNLFISLLMSSESRLLLLGYHIQCSVLGCYGNDITILRCITCAN